jgi:hypothetical protein
MTLTKEQILKAAMELDTEDRIELADVLFCSVSLEGQDEIAKAWLEESERRVEAFERGEIEDVPGEQALKELEAKYRK